LIVADFAAAAARVAAETVTALGAVSLAGVACRYSPTGRERERVFGCLGAWYSRTGGRGLAITAWAGSATAEPGDTDPAVPDEYPSPGIRFRAGAAAFETAPVLAAGRVSLTVAVGWCRPLRVTWPL
jgi:hypothetical protein